MAILQKYKNSVGLFKYWCSIGLAYLTQSMFRVQGMGFVKVGAT